MGSVHSDSSGGRGSLIPTKTSVFVSQLDGKSLGYRFQHWHVYFTLFVKVVLHFDSPPLSLTRILLVQRVSMARMDRSPDDPFTSEDPDEVRGLR